MRIKNFGNTSVAGVDFAASGRQAALLAMPRVEVRPVAAVASGWGTDVVGSDSRWVHAWRDGKGLAGYLVEPRKLSLLPLVPGT